MSKKSEGVIRWRKRLKEKMVLAMGKSCQCCGYNKCDKALEFHHIDPSQKDFSLSGVRANPKKLSVLIEELKKCILVCSNCHKEIHDGITHLPETYAILDESILVSENELRKRKKQQLCISKKVPLDRRKIFLSNDEINDLLESTFQGNKSALARYLNVSETAIRKRLN
jgi:hypothetical protein